MIYLVRGLVHANSLMPSSPSTSKIRTTSRTLTFPAEERAKMVAGLICFPVP